MNKGLAAGVTIGIAIAAIAGAYAFFGSQPDEPPEGSTGVGISEKAEVIVETPSEAEESSEEEKLGIKDAAEVEVEEPSEGGEENLGIKDSAKVEVEDPESISVSAEENIGFKEKTP